MHLHAGQRVGIHWRRNTYGWTRDGLPATVRTVIVDVDGEAIEAVVDVGADKFTIFRRAESFMPRVWMRPIDVQVRRLVSVADRPPRFQAPSIAKYDVDRFRQCALFTEDA